MSSCSPSISWGGGVYRGLGMLVAIAADARASTSGDTVPAILLIEKTAEW